MAKRMCEGTASSGAMHFVLVWSLPHNGTGPPATFSLCCRSDGTWRLEDEPRGAIEVIHAQQRKASKMNVHVTPCWIGRHEMEKGVLMRDGRMGYLSLSWDQIVLATG